MSVAIKNKRDVFFAGKRRVYNFTIRDAEGALVDLTGFTVRWRLSRRVGQAALISRSSPLDGGTILAPATNGRCQIVITPDLTTNLHGPCYWELELEDASGNQDIVAYGDVIIQKPLA